MVACKLDNFFKSLGRSFEEAKHRGNWNEKNIVFLIKAADKLAAKQVSEALKWVISLMVNGEPRSADILNVVNFCVRLVVALQENHVKVASAAVGSHTANNDVGVHEVIELHLLPWLAKTICIARDNGVRLQGVRLIRLICHSLSEMAALEVGLFDLLTEVMLDRARDRNSKVRCEAMDALRFFQNVQDRGCPVVKAITFHCQKDPNWQVRRAALSSLQMGTRSLLVIIARTADINPNVRATSYKIIGANVPYDKVNAVNRQIILKRGLSDIEQRVRSGFSKRVLKKWIAEDKGILNFLRENDVTSCPEIMRDALKAYFEDLLPEAIIEPVKEVLHDAKSVIKIDHLTPELCFYWKGAYEYLKAKIESEFPDFDPETRPKPFVEAPETEDEDKENRNEAEHGNRMRLFEALKQIQPLEVHFLDYVFDFKKRLNNVEAVRDNEASRALVEKIERHFMFNCLLEMLQFFPFTDVAARDKLCGMLKELLVDVDLPNTFLPAACAMMTKIFETEEAQNELLLEIVSDIRKPLRPDPVPVVIQTESRPLKSDPTMDLKFQKKRLEMERYGIERRMKKALDEMDTSQIAPLTEELTALKEKLSELAVQAAAEDAKTAAVVVPPSEETPEEEGEIPPAATVRGLEVIFEFLSRQKFSPIPPGLGHLIEKMVIPEIAVEDKCIRLAAVKCFIVLCPRSMDIAFKFLGVMFEIVRLDSDPVVAEKALIALFNALLRWGPALVNKQDLICSVVSASRLDSSNNTSLAGLPGKERIERKLTSLLDREEEELRIITADGLGKMMLDPRWRCSTVISDLFLANHVYRFDDSSSKVRQSIITFFKMYCFFVDDPETLVSAFMRALIILAQEIRDEEVDATIADNVGADIVELVQYFDARKSSDEDKRAEMRLAFELLTHLTDRTDTAVVLWMTFGRMIGWLCPPRDKFVAVRSLKASTAVVIQMKEWEQNKQFSRDLQRFMKRCEVVLSFAPKDMYPGESSISTENRTSTNNQDSMVAQISGFESEIDNDNETKENDQPAAGNLNSANERLVSVGAMSQFSSITSFDPMVCSTVRKPLLSINSEITESTVRDDDAVSDSVFDSSNHESNQPRRLNRTAVSEDSVIDSDTLASPRETGCISETSEDDEDCDETLTASVHRMEKKARKMDRVLRSAACLPETSGESGNIHSDSRDEEDEGSESHSDVEMMNISDDDDDRSMHAEGVVLSSQDVSPTVV